MILPLSVHHFKWLSMYRVGLMFLFKLYGDHEFTLIFSLFFSSDATYKAARRASNTASWRLAHEKDIAESKIW